MKIKRITAYQVDLPLHEGSYKWSGGKSVDVFDSTIVSIETDDGYIGYGECCPLGPFYLPAYAEGVRAGIKELGPHLIGRNRGYVYLWLDSLRGNDPSDHRPRYVCISFGDFWVVPANATGDEFDLWPRGPDRRHGNASLRYV